MAGVIVLGYDGAEAALAEAASLAKDLAADVAVAFGYRVWAAGGETQDQENAVRRVGESAATEAVAELKARGVHGEAVFVHERPAAAIVAVAAERNARMIVVGTQGEGLIRGALLGSVPYRLVHQAPCPVLVVPGKP